MVNPPEQSGGLDCSRLALLLAYDFALLSTSTTAFDAQVQILISAPEGYRIIAYNNDTGEALVTWEQYGQDLSTFKLPLDLDSEGNLLVVDSNNNRLIKFPIPSITPPLSFERMGGKLTLQISGCTNILCHKMRCCTKHPINKNVLCQRNLLHFETT